MGDREIPYQAGFHKTTIRTCLGELISILDKNTGQPNILEDDIKQATESLQKYLYTFFMQILRQNTRGSSRASSTTSLNLGLALKFFEETKTVLQENICDLSQTTRDWSRLKINLDKCGLLSRPELQMLDNILDNEGRYYEMYNIISKHPDWPEKLMKCLKASNNEHIADVLLLALECMEKRRLDQKHAYLDRREELVTEKEDKLAQFQKYERMITTSRTNRNSVADKISLAEGKEIEILVQIEKLNSANESEEMTNEKLRERRLVLQNELENLNELLRELNIKLDIFQTELETYEIELGELRETMAELQDEMNRVRSDFNEEKARNNTNENLLNIIKLENIQKVLRLKKQIDGLEEERDQLLGKEFQDIAVQPYKINADIAKLNSKIRNLQTSVEKSSQEAILGQGAFELSSERWDSYFRQLVTERDEELDVLRSPSRTNTTRQFLEECENWIIMKRLRLEEKKESSGDWKRFHERELENLEYRRQRWDRFGYELDFYDSIRSQYLDETFKKSIQRRISSRLTYIREQLERAYEKFVQFHGECHPCGCLKEDDDALPCPLHAVLIRCYVKVKRENYMNSRYLKVGYDILNEL